MTKGNTVKTLLNRALILSFLSIISFSSVALEEVDASLEEITNFRQYDSSFASSGQPSREQFQTLADNGFERIVYIGFSDQGDALSDADRLAKSLGMEYMLVPVDFANPLPDDFYAFADSMQRNTDKKTLLHCVVNARATAFSFLYRVIYEDVSVSEAKADMNTVWQPNDVWRDFIFEVLAQNNVSPECPDCDWTPRPIPNQ